VRLVLTLLVRDEEDVLDEHIAYHLSAGVSFVIATDHRSQDRTPEILESYERRGVLRVLREEGEFGQQSAWQSRMARLAATEHDAEWVIHSDADEFWWPRGPSLPDVLEAVDRRYGVVHGLVRNFVPRRDDQGWWADRMTLRFASPAPVNDPATPFRPVVKVAHRGDPDVVVGGGGAHQVFGVRGEVLRAWHPLEVLHVPFRSRTQSATKYRKAWTGWKGNPRGDLARARQGSDEGRDAVVWDRVALDDADCERGLLAGSLVSDTRLRDALRAQASDHRYPPPPPGRAELDRHADEVAVFQEAELVRFARWVDDLARRVRALEEAGGR
jgi:glycosyl transferase family 2